MKEHLDSKLVVDQHLDSKLVVDQHLDSKLVVDQHLDSKLVVDQHLDSKLVVDNSGQNNIWIVILVLEDKTYSMEVDKRTMKENLDRL